MFEMDLLFLKPYKIIKLLSSKPINDMRKLIFTLGLLFTSYVGFSQIAGCYFSEDMEPIDSVFSSSSTGLGGFFPNTRLFTSATKCDSAHVAPGDTTVLITAPIDVSAFTYIILQFNQICKIDFFDKAEIWVHSTSFGIDQQIVASQFVDTNQTDYQQFLNQFNSFNEASWGGLWVPGDSTAVPDNSWWRTEKFDLSAFQGLPDLQIRFVLRDAFNLGGAGRAGWFIDDICVEAAPCELIPPNIVQLSPLLQGTVYSLGPYNVNWSMTDNSGVDPNSTWLYYTINGTLDSTLMTTTGGNVFTGTIPAVNDSDVVCYYVTATDNSACLNSAIYPASGCIQFTATEGLSPTYCDNFDIPPPLWLDSAGATGSGSIWEMGIPTTGTPSAALSAPNVWEVGLNAIYQNSTSADLYSPHISFTNAVNAKLSVWLNYNTEQTWDGTRLEYTFDNGVTWTILGAVGDPNATNWYTNLVNCSNQDAWAGNSTTVPGNINGWYQAEYDLGAPRP